MKRLSSRLAAGLAAAALGLTTALAAGTPAAADDPIGGETATFIPSVGSGVVGVPVVINVSTTGSFTPGSSMQVTPVGSNSGAAAVIPVAVTAGQTSSFKFVPPHVGTWTFQAAGFTSTTTVAYQVNQVAVNISVSAPNSVKVGQPTTVTATVTPQGGSQLGVAGQVQFSIVGSGNIGAPVWLNQANPSVATIQWTPANVGQVQFRATLTPFKINGFPDVTCGSGCTSAPDTIQVTDSGVTVFLTNPPSFAAGVPATITAVVSAVPSAGSATFSVNGQVFAARVPVQANGQVSATWTPAAPGSYTIAVSWTGNSGATGSSQEVVTVGAAPAQADSIVLQQLGGPTWVPNTTTPVENGLTLTFSATTASGAAVTLTETGPCNLSGTTLVTDQGNGQCILTASSSGGNGLGAVSQNYTIQLVPGTQTATLRAPQSGRVNAGRTITLATKNQGTTNAGQDLVWTVTKGKSVCKLRFKNNGAVQLRVLKKGTCNVRARAGAVPGEWSRLTIKRHYRAV
jgi:hypothetical protein